LLALVEQMMLESASPEIAREFDGAEWLTGWLAAPAPALGGRPPINLLATAEGFDTVRRLLLSQQSGAYW
jgi:uncharacterized protein (DUF2384 family)